MNRITGILLFIFVLVLTKVDFDMCALILCVMTTVSAIQEGYYIKKGESVIDIMEKNLWSS